MEQYVSCVRWEREEGQSSCGSEAKGVGLMQVRCIRLCHVCTDYVSCVQICCDMRSVAVICVMCVVLWVADEDVSFYEIEWAAEVG